MERLRRFLTGCTTQSKRIAAEMPDISRLSTRWRFTIGFLLFWTTWSWHFLIALMFLPTMVAFCRSHRNWPLVFLANVALGWTPMWFVILAYAVWSRTVMPIPGDAVMVRVTARMNPASW